MKELIKSVGIDIGTSTTQIIFSHIYIENMASDWAVPDMAICERKIIYEGEIYLTPLISNNEIDVNELKKIVDIEYKNAKINKCDIKTGAVIITGDTARKDNSKEVLNVLSEYAGDFIVKTAGPDLESILAGRGAGTEGISKENKKRVVNIDIGGGTSNIALYDNGNLVSTTCLDIGGRLIKFNDEKDKITYIYKGLEKYLTERDLKFQKNNFLDDEKLEKVSKILATELLNSITKNGANKSIYTNGGDKLLVEKPVENVTFSGGVASLIYEILHGRIPKNKYPYNDIGYILAKEIINVFESHGIKILEPLETIRATVLGAGMHVVEISGSTIYYRNVTLPKKNIPIIKLSEFNKYSINEMDIFIRAIIESGEDNAIAVSFTGIADISYEGIKKASNVLIKGLSKWIERKLVIVIITEQDIAKALGFFISGIIGNDYPLISIDSISVKNGDYVDIGVPCADGMVLPVVIKTIVFNV